LINDSKKTSISSSGEASGSHADLLLIAKLTAVSLHRM